MVEDPTGGTRNEFSGQSDVSVQAGVIHGGAHIAAPATPQPPIPGQLIAGPRHFVSQRLVLARLAALLGERQGTEPAGPRVAVLHGVGGVGKTAAALTTAHQHKAWFSDGQLYVDLAQLAGTTSTDVDDVLAGFLTVPRCGPR